MEKRKKITQYRERLDRTLTSPHLTTEETLKALVKNQVLQSLKHETEGCNDNVVDRRTAEVSNFLDMLRSVSSSGVKDGSKASEMAHPEWKIKQDNEDFRVMYREGLEGTPFHTLLVEGFVDGPVDTCLCISWESELYKKWWPQMSVPTFKILSSKCLQKVRIGEQISLVRVKVSWPLSTREVIVHYFLFESIEDDLIIVLLKSISDNDNIDMTTHGFTNEAIPEAEDVVRIDLVGGYAIQKVTDNRSYLRTMATVDIKLDFVPPSLINFVSRQLIGNGFRLYQKVVASALKSDDFNKALKDPLYIHINESLFQRKEQDNVIEEKKFSDAIDQIEDHFHGEQPENLTEEDQNVCGTDHATEPAQTVVSIKERKSFGEIEEEEESKESRHSDEDDVDKDNNLVKSIPEICHFKGHRISIISVEVEKALETLDEVINMVRKCGFKNEAKTPPFLTNEKASDVEQNSNSSDDSKICSKVEFSVCLSKKEAVERVSDQLLRTNSTHSSRLGLNSLSKEVNHSKIVPASPEPKFSTPAADECYRTISSSIEHGTIGNLIQGRDSLDPEKQKSLTSEHNGIDEFNHDVEEGTVRNKKSKYWCLPRSPMPRIRRGRS